jgi:hypothetical protein
VVEESYWQSLPPADCGLEGVAESNVYLLMFVEAFSEDLVLIEEEVADGSHHYFIAWLVFERVQKHLAFFEDVLVVFLFDLLEAFELFVDEDCQIQQCHVLLP